VLAFSLRENILEKKKMSRKSALAQYSNIDVEAKAASESPSQLISLLFDKACVLLRQGGEALSADDFETFDKSTTHALQIVMALRGVLDMERGGEVAKSLYDTYTSIAASLFKTKSTQDAESLGKLYLAMSELREAWQQVP
jgi:flagellar protein FliS|tara:strand:- start:1113 stop:1535 length:423 start_codon:yes stop_codon:yes gene_type:complete